MKRREKVFIGGVNIPAPSNSREQRKAEKVAMSGGTMAVNNFIKPEVTKVSTYIVWNNEPSARERIINFLVDNEQILHLFKKKEIAKVMGVSHQYLNSVIREFNQ